MSYYARIVLSGRTLYPEKLKDVRERILKYAGQLAEIANEFDRQSKEFFGKGQWILKKKSFPAGRRSI